MNTVPAHASDGAHHQSQPVRANESARHTQSVAQGDYQNLESGVATNRRRMNAQARAAQQAQDDLQTRKSVAGASNSAFTRNGKVPFYLLWEGKAMFARAGRIALFVNSPARSVASVIFATVMYTIYYADPVGVRFHSGGWRSLAVLLPLHVLLVWLLWKLISTDPGVLPRRIQPMYYEPEIQVIPERLIGASHSPSVIVQGQAMKLKFCTTCNLHRPPRAWHCPVCDHCIDGADHHCPWLNVCIGKRNYLYFVLYLTTIFVSTAYIAADIIATTVAENNFKSSIEKRPHHFVLFVFCLLVMGAIGWLLSFHIYLILTNQTTVEYQKQRSYFQYQQILRHIKMIIQQPFKCALVNFTQSVQIYKRVTANPVSARENVMKVDHTGQSSEPHEEALNGGNQDEDDDQDADNQQGLIMLETHNNNGNNNRSVSRSGGIHHATAPGDAPSRANSHASPRVQHQNTGRSMSGLKSDRSPTFESQFRESVSDQGATIAQQRTIHPDTAAQGAPPGDAQAYRGSKSNAQRSVSVGRGENGNDDSRLPDVDVPIGINNFLDDNDSPEDKENFSFEHQNKRLSKYSAQIAPATKASQDRASSFVNSRNAVGSPKNENSNSEEMIGLSGKFDEASMINESGRGGSVAHSGAEVRNYALPRALLAGSTVKSNNNNASNAQKDISFADSVGAQDRSINPFFGDTGNDVQ